MDAALGLAFAAAHDAAQSEDPHREEVAEEAERQDGRYDVGGDHGAGSGKFIGSPVRRVVGTKILLTRKKVA